MGHLDLRWQREDTRDQRLSKLLKPPSTDRGAHSFSLPSGPRLRCPIAEGGPLTKLELSAEPVIVRLPDEIDMNNAEDVGEHLRSAFTRGAAVVIADLTSTVFCDSSGVRQLLLSHNYADFHDAQMRFVIPGGSVLRVLTLTGIDQFLSVYPNLDAAVSAGSMLNGDAASW
jgi:anti-sigma B factor antagonist